MINDGKYKKIAVIAANGRSGKVFVEEALGAGYTVKAGIRGRNNLGYHPNLTVVKCDATKLDDLGNLISGQDAVASFIGHVKNSPQHLQTDAMKALCKAMKTEGIRRCVSLTGTGVRFAGDRVTLRDRILNVAVGIVDPARIKDGKNHVEFLQNTDLDWTVLRVLKLQNTRPGAFRLSANGPAKTIVSRQEVAKAVIEILDQDAYIRQAPIVSKK